MKEDVILAVKDLSVIYQTDLETVYAVNGVSFTLGRGESPLGRGGFCVGRC